MKVLATLLGLATAIGLSGCTSPDYINLVHEDHAPGYQRVNTVEKARAFYPNSTLVSRTFRYFSADGTPITDNKIPIGSHIRKNGFEVLYLAPSGAAYLVSSDSTQVYSGTWTIDQFGRAYPRVCSLFPALSAKPDCVWPSAYLGKGDNARLYRGDIAHLGQKRYPSALQRANPIATLQSVIRSIGAGTPRPFTANQAQ